MVSTPLYQINKETKNKLSLYVNIIVFFIVALFIYLLIVDTFTAGKYAADNIGATMLSQAWLLVARDVAIIAIGFTWLFFQFFKNQLLVMQKTW